MSYSAFVVEDIEATVSVMRCGGAKFTRAQRENKETKVYGPIAYDEWGAFAFNRF